MIDLVNGSNLPRGNLFGVRWGIGGAPSSSVLSSVLDVEVSSLPARGGFFLSACSYPRAARHPCEQPCFEKGQTRLWRAVRAAHKEYRK